MEHPVHQPDPQNLASDAQRITGESMLHYLPGTPQTLPPRPQMQDVVMLRFSHHSIVEPILVPAVVDRGPSPCRRGRIGQGRE